jgi:hypothetical protein
LIRGRWTRNRGADPSEVDSAASAVSADLASEGDDNLDEEVDTDDLEDDLDEDDLDEDDRDEDDLDEDEPDDEDDFDVVDHSLRDEGPYDLDEVDLDADDITRIDLGCVILTPFDGMQLQLQVDQANSTVQSALIMHGQSALEVALFAAPARESMLRDVLEDMERATLEAGGEFAIGDGPYGALVDRTLPVQGPEGQQLVHVSRLWFAQGPRWMLRGTLMGEAVTGHDEAAVELLMEVYRSVVVNRDDAPRVPGDLIPMTIPAGLAPDQSGENADGPAQAQ